MYETWILWGSHPESEDAISHYSFNTAEELAAFLYGVDEASGWLESTVCESEEEAKRELAQYLDATDECPPATSPPLA